MADQATNRIGVRARPGRDAQATLLLREGAFAIPSLSGVAETRMLGSLEAYVHTVLARPQPAGARLGGVFGEVRRCGQQLYALRFCLNELLPLLRSSGTASGRGAYSPTPLSSTTFRGLEKQAAKLLRLLNRPSPPLESTEELAALLGTPCAVVGKEVIPLAPAVCASPGTSFVHVAGERYIPRVEGARPLRNLIGELRQEQRRRAQQQLKDQPELNQLATEFLAELKRILDRCGPRNCGPYEIFHRDADHQLQHCRGQWILVRGPVARRTEKGDIFVGLPLVGRTRPEWIAVPPRTRVAAGGFWGARGGALRGGICMGGSAQYARLCSNEFSDAEAVVEWLDAGVILATGRSDYHRTLRALEKNDDPTNALGVLERLMGAR